MKKSGKNKLIALGITLLLVAATLISYALTLYQRPAIADATPDPIQQTFVKTADNSTPRPIIKAGPTQGYEPLTVHFYGNPANDSTIVSYSWTFGPKGGAILTRAGYDEIGNKPLFKIYTLLIGITFLSMFTASPTNLAFPIIMFYILFAATFIVAIFQQRQINLHKDYTSILRDPTMVFLYPGSYSATLTETDKTGNTTTDTVWITVLQYIYPDNDSHSGLRHLLRSYISSRT